MIMYLATLGLMLFCSLVSASEQDYELNQHIRGTKWQWDGNGGEVVVFAANGYIEHEGWTQRGLVTRWEVIDKRTVRLTIERGRTQDKYAFLIFNDDITSYGGINFHRGDKLHTSTRLDNGTTTASVNQTNSNVAQAQTTTPIDKNAAVIDRIATLFKYYPDVEADNRFPKEINEIAGIIKTLSPKNIFEERVFKQTILVDIYLTSGMKMLKLDLARAKELYRNANDTWHILKQIFEAQ